MDVVRTAGNKRRASRISIPVECTYVPEDITASSITYTFGVPENSTSLHYRGQNIDVSVDHFDCIEMRGRGNYGYVVEVSIRNHPDVHMAVKRIMLETNEERQTSTQTDLRTIQNVGSENFPFIVAYYGAVIDTRLSELLICMELMDAAMDKFYQSMHSFHNVTFDELDHVLRRLTNNITSALHFLKMRRILHRDVKPQNMLINRQAIFKLCDFGISGLMRPSQSLVVGPVQGTHAYLPPEVITGRVDRYGIRVDMWGLGISLLEIINGKHPFSDIYTNLFKMRATIDNWEPAFSSNFTISMDMEQIILNLLKNDPEQRPKTYPEILEVAVIRDVQQSPPDEEIAFITRVIDNISPPTPNF